MSRETGHVQRLGPESFGRDEASLYELYGELNRQSDAAGRRRLVEVIMLKLEPRLQRACRVVLRPWKKNLDWQDELVQQTNCRVVELLLDAHSKYKDAGPAQFNGWILRMVLMAARRAWKQCRPFGLKGKLLRPRARATSWAEATIDWEDAIRFVTVQQRRRQHDRRRDDGLRLVDDAFHVRQRIGELRQQRIGKWFQQRLGQQQRQRIR